MSRHWAAFVLLHYAEAQFAYVLIGGGLGASSSFVFSHESYIRVRRSDTALTATMIDERDMSNADTSGRSDQPSER